MKDIRLTCAEKLEQLAKNITVSDRNDALTEIPISRPTLDKYLIGDVVKIDTATKLIRFFSGRVNNRIKELESTN